MTVTAPSPHVAINQTGVRRRPTPCCGTRRQRSPTSPSWTAGRPRRATSLRRHPRNSQRRTATSFTALGDQTISDSAPSDRCTPFGPTTEPGVNIGFGYRGELETIPGVHLRARALLPAVGVLGTVDPLDGVAGTPPYTNPYHYADNDPINKVDPAGLRPSDSQFEPDRPNDPDSFRIANIRFVAGCTDYSGPVFEGACLAADMLESGSSWIEVQPYLLGLNPAARVWASDPQLWMLAQINSAAAALLEDGKLLPDYFVVDGEWISSYGVGVRRVGSRLPERNGFRRASGQHWVAGALVCGSRWLPRGALRNRAVKQSASSGRCNLRLVDIRSHDGQQPVRRLWSKLRCHRRTERCQLSNRILGETVVRGWLRSSGSLALDSELVDFLHYGSSLVPMAALVAMVVINAGGGWLVTTLALISALLYRYTGIWTSAQERRQALRLSHGYPSDEESQRRGMRYTIAVIAVLWVVFAVLFAFELLT